MAETENAAILASAGTLVKAPAGPLFFWELQLAAKHRTCQGERTAFHKERIEKLREGLAEVQFGMLGHVPLLWVRIGTAYE